MIRLLFNVWRALAWMLGPSGQQIPHAAFTSPCIPGLVVEIRRTR
jgi:hypothetical protein